MEEAADPGGGSRPTGGAGINVEVNDSHGDVQNSRRRTATSAVNNDQYLCIETTVTTLNDMIVVASDADCVRIRL